MDPNSHQNDQDPLHMEQSILYSIRRNSLKPVLGQEKQGEGGRWGGGGIRSGLHQRRRGGRGWRREWRRRLGAAQRWQWWLKAWHLTKRMTTMDGSCPAMTMTIESLALDEENDDDEDWELPSAQRWQWRLKACHFVVYLVCKKIYFWLCTVGIFNIYSRTHIYLLL